MFKIIEKLKRYVISIIANNKVCVIWWLLWLVWLVW